MSKLDKFCDKYYAITGLPFRFDGGLYLMDTDEDGNAVITDISQAENNDADRKDC